MTHADVDPSHVRVVARIRPLSKTEIERKSEEAVTSLSSLEKSLHTRNSFQLSNEPELLQVQVTDGQKRWFELDAVFDKNSTQEEVYIKCGAREAVREYIFKGFNCTVLAYGQVSCRRILVCGVTCFMICGHLHEELALDRGWQNLFDGDSRRRKYCYCGRWNDPKMLC